MIVTYGLKLIIREFQRQSKHYQFYCNDNNFANNVLKSYPKIEDCNFSKACSSDSRFVQVQGVGVVLFPFPGQYSLPPKTKASNIPFS